MSKIRIVFLGTPEFAAASLRRLIADENFEIVAVVSQPDRPAGRKMQLKPSPVKELALAHGLKVFTPETVNKQEFRDQIGALGAESAAVVAFGQILGQKFLDLFPKGCVNVHGSLLPRWRGAAPIQRSLMAGDQETGVALQIVVRALDAGPVLGIRKVAIDDDLDAAKLHDQLKDLGADLLALEYSDYLHGHLTPVAQDESLVTIAPKIDKAEARLDWNRSAREIMNQVRGLQMGPFAFTMRAGQALKVHRTRVLEESGVHGQPGEVVGLRGASGGAPQTFTVAGSQGLLEVLEVQPESRSRQTSAEYLRGYPLKAGDRFD
jgi:methionyl-tRNA formyltransferase